VNTGGQHGGQKLLELVEAECGRDLVSFFDTHVRHIEVAMPSAAGSNLVPHTYVLVLVLWLWACWLVAQLLWTERGGGGSSAKNNFRVGNSVQAKWEYVWSYRLCDDVVNGTRTCCCFRRLFFCTPPECQFLTQESKFHVCGITCAALSRSLAFAHDWMPCGFRPSGHLTVPPCLVLMV
jgi:hypothetical protein